jgi:hypothetical protein
MLDEATEFLQFTHRHYHPSINRHFPSKRNHTRMRREIDV